MEALRRFCAARVYGDEARLGSASASQRASPTPIIEAGIPQRALSGWRGDTERPATWDYFVAAWDRVLDALEHHCGS